MRFSERDFHHLSHVMRIAVQEEIEVVVRDTWDAYHVRVIALSDNVISAEILGQLVVSSRYGKVGLVFGLSKGDKNDSIVRQAVEIGADFIYPTLFERSIVKLDEKKAVSRVQRLRTIAKAAAQQSHRKEIPHIADIQKLKAPALAEEMSTYDAVYVLWEETQRNALSLKVDELLGNVGDTASVLCVVGPEGGITNAEIEYLTEQGAQTASLGPTILRVDTANAVALAIVLSKLNSVYEETNE